jgi:hypothetical protein
MQQFTAVQITGKNLDPMYKGCLGIILEDNITSSTVGIYYPEVSGKNAYVKKVDFNDVDLTPIGEVILKPKL